MLWIPWVDLGNKFEMRALYLPPAVSLAPLWHHQSHKKSNGSPSSTTGLQLNDLKARILGTVAFHRQCDQQPRTFMQSSILLFGGKTCVNFFQFQCNLLSFAKAWDIIIAWVTVRWPKSQDKENTATGARLPLLYIATDVKVTTKENVMAANELPRVNHTGVRKKETIHLKQFHQKTFSPGFQWWLDDKIHKAQKVWISLFFCRRIVHWETKINLPIDPMPCS